VPSILGVMEGCVKAKTLFSGRAVHAVSIANRRLGANLGVAAREPCRHLLTDTCAGGSIAWRDGVGRVFGKAKAGRSKPTPTPVGANKPIMVSSRTSERVHPQAYRRGG
jgi:hypothetical protein